MRVPYRYRLAAQSYAGSSDLQRRCAAPSGRAHRAPQQWRKVPALADLDAIEFKPRLHLPEFGSQIRNHPSRNLSWFQKRTLHHENASRAVGLEIAPGNQRIAEQKTGRRSAAARALARIRQFGGGERTPLADLVVDLRRVSAAPGSHVLLGLLAVSLHSIAHERIQRDAQQARRMSPVFEELAPAVSQRMSACIG